MWSRVDFGNHYYIIVCASDDEDRQGALQDVPGRGDGRYETHQDSENGYVVKKYADARGVGGRGRRRMHAWHEASRKSILLFPADVVCITFCNIIPWS